MREPSENSVTALNYSFDSKNQGCNPLDFSPSTYQTTKITHIPDSQAKKLECKESIPLSLSLGYF